MDEMIKYLKALTFLQLQALTGGTAYQKPEQLLERAGFAHREIAEMLGKSPNAVTKTLIRAKAGTRN